MSLFELIQWRRVPDRVLELYHKYADDIAEAWAEKSAGGSELLPRILQTLNLQSGTYPGGIPNHARPLTGMLFGGMAGAGLGYGLGALGEKLLPEKWERNRLRRTLALMGGAAGTMPGAIMGGVNLLGKKPFNDMSMWQAKTSSQQDMTGMFGLEPIDVNEFNQIVWKDPRVSRPLSPHIQAAATGLITGAANLPGKQNSRWVTPMDVGRMAAGMGVGYLSGALVGAGLGAMMGMPRETQDKMKSTGMWAGLITSLVPKAFGG